MERIVQILNRWRVRAGLPSVLFTIFLAKPNYYSLLSGFGFYLLGMLLRAWSSGHLKKEVELTTSGPYRYTRNPLYLGNLLMGMGVVAAARSWGVLIVIGLYFLVFYPAIIFNYLFLCFPGVYIYQTAMDTLDNLSTAAGFLRNQVLPVQLLKIFLTESRGK